MGRLSLRVRRGAAVAIAATLAGGLAACGGSAADGPTTLRFVWWGNEDRAKATNEAVAAFEKKHPNIDVTTEFSGYDAYFQKLSTQIAGGAGPDVLQIARANTTEYQSRNVLAELDPYIDSGELRTEHIPDDLFGEGKIDGKQYTIPAGRTTQMLVLDSKVFADAGIEPPTDAGEGWTWQEFETAMVEIGETGVAGTTDFGWAVDWFEVWLHQQGKELYTEDGRLGFTAAELTEFWNLTGSMREAGGATEAEDTTKMDGSTQNSALVAKQSASEINYDSNLTGYLSAYGGELVAAPLPSDGETTGMSAQPPVSYAVSNRSENKDAAVKLVDFLVNDPEAGKILGTTRSLPPNEKIREQVCAEGTELDAVVCDYQQAVADKTGPAFRPWPNGAAVIKRDFQRIYDDVMFGRISAEEGAERVIQTGQQVLREG